MLIFNQVHANLLQKHLFNIEALTMPHTCIVQCSIEIDGQLAIIQISLYYE